MSTFILCRLTYIWYHVRSRKDRYEKITRYCRDRSDFAAVAWICRAVAPWIDRSANGVGALWHAGLGCRRQPVLPGVFVPQSGRRRIRRDFPALAAVDAACHSGDDNRY